MVLYSRNIKQFVSDDIQGAKYSLMDNMSLLRSYELNCNLQPPVETGGYKYFAPTERDAEGLSRLAGAGNYAGAIYAGN